ncbi:MAG: hypothetical protein CENE_00099 [Candidatus Celerinatantimonas neptuna]|nr:MAG: hypothetical protein CENE_00099 [Candidatus Celerinatantimonas neptuna]
MWRWFSITVVIWLVLGTAYGQSVVWGSSERIDFKKLPEDTSMGSLVVGNLLYDPLFRYNAKGAAIPWLVSQWKQLSPTRIVFQLRAHVFFSSGNRLTSQDVSWSFNTLLKHGDFRQLFGMIKSINPLTPSRFLVVLKTPCPNLLGRLTYLFVYDRLWLRASHHHSTLLVSGSGPFQLTEQIKNIRAVLKRKSKTWNHPDQGNINQLVVIPIRHEQTRFSALLNGDVDITDHLNMFRYSVLTQLPQFQMFLVRHSRWVGLLFNGFAPALQNKVVRKALSMGINASMLRMQLVGHLGGKTYQNELLPDAGQRDYSSQAYQLLNKEGYGSGIKLRVVVEQLSDLDSEQALHLLKLMLRRLNIDVRAQILSPTRFRQALSKCEGDLFFLAMKNRPNDLISHLNTMLKNTIDAPAALNCSPQRERLLKEFDVLKKQELSMSDIYHRLSVTINHQYDFKPLFWQSALWASRSMIHIPHGRYPLGLPYFDEMKVDTKVNQ